MPKLRGVFTVVSVASSGLTRAETGRLGLVETKVRFEEFAGGSAFELVSVEANTPTGWRIGDEWTIGLFPTAAGATGSYIPVDDDGA